MNPVGKIEKIDKIEDDPDDKRFPAQWIDTRHEVDGTDTMYVETSFSACEIGGDGPRVYDEDEVNYYLHTGPNTGAEILSGEMQEIARRLTGFMPRLRDKVDRSLAQMTCQGRPLMKGLSDMPEYWR